MKQPSFLFRTFAWLIIGIILFTLLGVAIATRGDTVPSVKITFLTAPANLNTITVNGSVRTFKTSVTTAATEVAIGASALLTANAYATQIGTYPYSGVYAYQDGTNITLFGLGNSTLTVTASGSWYTITTNAGTVTQYTLNLPLSGEPTNRQTAIANDLAAALQNFPTTNFSPTAYVLTNYLALSSTQTVTGPKTFTGTTVLTAGNVSGGSLSNMTLGSQLFIYQNPASGAGITFIPDIGIQTYTLAPGLSGFPALWDTTATLNLTNPVSSYVPDANSLLIRGAADTRYGQLTNANTWTGTNSFARITNSFLTGVTSTNSIGGFTNLWVTNLFVQKAMAITNGNQNALTFVQPAAAVDNRLWVVGGSSTNFGIQVTSDDGVSTAWALRLSRNGTTPDAMLISCANLNVTSAATFTGALYSTGGLRASGVSVLGSSSSSTAIPGSLSAGALFFDGTGAGADPAAGSAQWSESGVLKYRGQAADGGSGGDRFLHNRASQVTGSGTDFTPGGTAFARLDFGGTDVEITLPTASTYLVSADLDFTEATVDYDLIKAKFYNSTAAADVANSERWTSNTKVGSHVQIILQSIVTTSTANNLLQVYVANTTAARGTFGAVLTNIRYVRLY